MVPIWIFLLCSFEKVDFFLYDGIFITHAYLRVYTTRLTNFNWYSGILIFRVVDGVWEGETRKCPTTLFFCPATLFFLSKRTVFGKVVTWYVQLFKQ